MKGKLQVEINYKQNSGDGNVKLMKILTNKKSSKIGHFNKILEK